MAGEALLKLEVRGLASLRDVALELTTPVTLLIGANGSGKSNLVRSLELLGEIVDRRLQQSVAERGGFDRMLHHGNPRQEAVDTIELRIEGVPDEQGNSNAYRARLSAGSDDRVLLSETMYFHAPSHRRPYDEPLGVAAESRLSQQPPGKKANFAAYVQKILTSCRVYHFDDVSPNAPPKTSSDVADNVELRRDGANIAAYLLRLRTDDPSTYERIVGAVRSVAPFFEDFVLLPQGRDHSSVILRWRQTSCDEVFGASQCSDGTLRFICLATLLMSPDRPWTIVLDEPELGLHPFAIHQLAELVTAAARGGRRLVLATQSVPLLEEFPLESIVVVERRDGATVLTRPDQERLADFVQEYSLGELWRMNLLGGRPGPEETPAP